MTTEVLVRVENVSRYYGAVAALQAVSFEISRGEVLGLLGPNGAGKSTLMQIISGTLAPSAGRVWINGVDILDEPKRAKALLGYLPDQPPLYRELTVDEYLAYCARLHRIPRGECARALLRAKARCGLSEVGRRLIGNLSKGYKQRVGIAQAIIHNPQVVILDEPTVGLDPIQIREIRALIKALSGDHSVILSTHILPEVQSVCDRVRIINKGQLVYNDTLANLQQRNETTRSIVAFHQTPELSELAAVTGVTAVDALETGRVRIHYAADHNPAAALVECAVQRGWGLYELTPERMSLEQIFVDITQGDAPHAVVEAA